MKYTGFAFRQNKNAPLQISLVLATCDLDEWARVPTRLSNRPQGFQRAAVKGHIAEIEKFFQQDPSNTNASPTSILVGLAPEAQSLVSLVDPDSGGAIDPVDVGTAPVRCDVELDFDPWQPDDDFELVNQIGELAAVVEAAVAASDEEADTPDAEIEDDEESAADAKEPLDEEDSDVEDDEESAADAKEPLDEDDGDAEDTDEERQSTGTTETSDSDDGEESAAEALHLFSYGELRDLLASKAYESWDEDDLVRLRDLLVDERKPGLIIDGQHRVAATRNIGEVPFIVSFLPFANWAELAFQFIVNNSSAKKVDENLLFAIVGQSLEPEQLSEIEGRLNRSGIKVNLIKASMRVHLDANPFAGMLKTNTPGEKGFLDATAMQKKVIELWYGSKGSSGTRATLKKFRAITDDPGRSKEFRMLDLFGANCGAATAREKAEEWQDGLWFDYFTAFWEAVRDRYQGDGLWPQSIDAWPPVGVGSATPDQQNVQNLMGATILGMLQIAVLQRWAQLREDRALSDGQDFKTMTITPVDFGDQIRNILKPLSPDFFQAYIRSGADASKQVKQIFIRALMDVLTTNKTVAEVRASSDSFRS
ncbi:hypothetical protein [Mycobacterium scrofulaceum]|uniref:DGQHR domain-containing protein n=1 Tax=Mycobacterium scrofulaceum TaxID=1783 RepID=A0A1A2UED4_MYCSC|nr:hypothetical protein [Mycobacterium scrofulaceum]OBH86642.1 hypothetical protein A5679_26870 [Mycobacterium scrofulaceum]